MKFKTVLAITLVGVMSLAVLSGCTKKDVEGGSSNQTSAPTTSAPPQKAASGQLKTIHQKVLDIYGENYSAQPIDAVILEQMYGVKPDMVKEFVADAPMMNVKVDTFIGVEAAEGKAEEVETALNAYKEKNLKEKTDFGYLADHLPKAQNAQVVRVDDYVFFVMIADVNEVPEGEMVDSIKKQIQTIVDLIKETVK